MRALFARAPRPRRHDAARSPRSCSFDLGLRPDPLPGLPDAGGPQRRRRCWPSAAGAVSANAEDAEDRAPARPAAPRALDDPAHGVRGVLPDGRRHRGRREGDGDPVRVPGERRGLARLLPRPASPTSTRCATTSSFERFLNPMRDELPDIDIDVESARREDVYDMVLSRHGDDRAACVAMIDTYRARARRSGRWARRSACPRSRSTWSRSRSRTSRRAHLREAIDRLPELAGHQPARSASSSCCSGGRAARRVPAAHRAASVRHRAVQPRPGRPGAAGAHRRAATA